MGHGTKKQLLKPGALEFKDGTKEAEWGREKINLGGDIVKY